MDIHGNDLELTVPNDIKNMRTLLPILICYLATEGGWGIDNMQIEQDTDEWDREMAFIYRSPEARKSWDTDGCTEEYGADMIHLIWKKTEPTEPQHVTIVVGEQSEIEKVVQRFIEDAPCPE